MHYSPYLIAIDFDSTLFHDGWPDVRTGYLVKETVERMMEQLLLKPDTEFILWTCRAGKHLEDAKEIIRKYNLPIYYFNENHPITRTWFDGEESRKIFSHEYWDDRSIPMGVLHPHLNYHRAGKNK